MHVAVIRAMASYLPEKILTNDDLSTMVDTSDEWIVTRTGIKERRIAAPDEHASTMGAKAALSLLSKTKYDKDSIDLIITSTMTPDYLSPSTAALLQHMIGATNAAAFDINAACSGFVYGLATAKAFIESGLASSILLVSTEKNSSFIDYTNRNTCVIFGDGASACLITKGGPGLAITSTTLGASGEGSDLVIIPAGGCRLPASAASVAEKLHYIHMNGKELFKHAVRRMEESVKKCLEEAHLTEDKIRWLIPHQANIRIIDALAKRFSIPQDRVVITIDSCANTSSASIPISLDGLLSQKKIQNSDFILVTAFGGGLTWGTALLQAHHIEKVSL